MEKKDSCSYEYAINQLIDEILADVQSLFAMEGFQEGDMSASSLGAAEGILTGVRIFEDYFGKDKSAEGVKVESIKESEVGSAKEIEVGSAKESEVEGFQEGDMSASSLGAAEGGLRGVRIFGDYFGKDKSAEGVKVESVKEIEVGSATESEVESAKESEVEGFQKGDMSASSLGAAEGGLRGARIFEDYFGKDKSAEGAKVESETESEAVMVEPGNPSETTFKCPHCGGYVESEDAAKKSHSCHEHAKWAAARTITTNLLGAATTLLGYLHDFIAQHREGIIDFSKFLATGANCLPPGSSQKAAQVLAKMILLVVMLESEREARRNRR